jgi:ATP-binding protein involved in chromosome partitioning
MSYLPCPHCGPEHRIEVFGSGGADRVAHTLAQRFGYPVPVLGRVPLDERLRAGGDSGDPIVAAEPESLAAQELRHVAETLSGRSRGLAGRQLGLTPAVR